MIEDHGSLLPRPALKCSSCDISLSPERRREALATGESLCWCCLEMQRSVKYRAWFLQCDADEKEALEEAKHKKKSLLNPDSGEWGPAQ